MVVPVTLLVIAGGVLAMTIIGVLIGASLDTSAQQRVHRQVAEERRRLSVERHERRQERGGGNDYPQLPRHHPPSDHCPSCGSAYPQER